MDTGMTTCRSLIVALLLAPQFAIAEIYTWVDEKGQKHFGDQVPEKYQHQSTTVELNVRQPSASDAARTKEDAELQRTTAEHLEADRTSRPTPAPNVARQVPASGKAAGPAVSQQAYQNMSCEEKWKVYQESDACYAKCATISTNTETVLGPRGYGFETTRGRSTAGCEACGNYAQPPPCL